MNYRIKSTIALQFIHQATILTPTQGNFHVRFPINARNQPIPTPIDLGSGGGRAVNIFPLFKSKRHLSDQ